jgi:hypothetical protein
MSGFFSDYLSEMKWLNQTSGPKRIIFFMFDFPYIISLYYIKNQQNATLAVLFISHCKITTCFGCFLRPSPGVLKTVVAATGACHGSG